MNKVAVALFSGGLDSTLAIKIMLNQGIEIFCIHFKTPFCRCKFYKCNLPENIPMKFVYLGEEYIDIVKSPKFGYGDAMNPCIDCRILMLTKAAEYMKSIGASFIITGEVLGQRPMTQMKNTMRFIEKQVGLAGKILRPLSAKLLPPTEPEIAGIVNREALYGISGRSRKEQMKLANDFGIENYPQPGCGCALTDPTFSKRVKDAIIHNETSLHYMNLLNYGRHFRLPDGSKLIVGRNEVENNILKKLKNGMKLIEPIDCKGPVALFNGNDLLLVAGICARYCNKKANVKFIFDGKIIAVNSVVDVEKYRI